MLINKILCQQTGKYFQKKNYFYLYGFILSLHLIFE